MSVREGCGRLALGCLFVVVACLVFLALVGSMVLTGEVPLNAPYLTAFEPEPDTAYRPTTPITLTFDQAMNPSSVEEAFALLPLVAGTFHWNEDRTQVSFVPSPPGYEPGTTYRVRLPPGIEAGTLPRTTERAKEWSFTLPPLLQSRTSLPVGEDVGARPRWEASFNYTLDCSPTLRTYEIAPQADAQLECSDRALSVVLTESLEPGTAYVVGFQHAYLQGDSTPRPGVRWEFQTPPSLTVEILSPDMDLELIDLSAAFRIAFNRPVVPSSAMSRVSLMASDGSTVDGELVWSEDGAALAYQPREPLRPNDEYRLIVREGVEDTLGFVLAEPLARSVRTAPMVTEPSPVPGFGGVALDSSILIPFTRPMDRASVEAGLVFTPSLDGQFTWEAETLVFTPRGGLAAETAYQAGLSRDVRDANGAPLAEPVQWAFETEPFLLEARVPTTGLLMELQQPIQFGFALPMDLASVDAALVISPATPGELIWSDEGRTATFQPAPAWQAGVEYELHLSGRAQTADRTQRMGTDRTWRFSTGAAKVRFGEGPHVQVLNAGGDRALQITTHGADTADLRLYAITPTQFLDLCSPGLQDMSRQGPEILDTTGLTPTVAWREVLWTGDAPGRDGEWQKAEAHLPPDVPTGLYVLTADPAPEEQGQLVVVLSHHALVLKRATADAADSGSSATGGRARILAWDTHIRDGAPVVSATVQLFDRIGTLLAEGQTDSTGLLMLEMASESEPLLALSQWEGDVTACGLGTEWSGSVSRSEKLPRQPSFTTYLYSDRPIYHPGQTIRFKGLLRFGAGVSYTVPGPDVPVSVRLRDSRDNVVATQVLTPTAFGTVYGAFPLDPGAMLGRWTLETDVAGYVSRQTVRVEEYREADYDVAVHTPGALHVLGEAISVTITADYRFGQPVDGADVILNIYPAYPNAVFGEADSRFGYPLQSEKGRTDGQGRWSAVVDTDDVLAQEGHPQVASLALEAIVTDASGQSASNYQTVVVHRASESLGILLGKRGYEPDEEIMFAAEVRDLEGEPVPTVGLVGEVSSWDGQVVGGATAETDRTGIARFSITLSEQGHYRLKVSGFDERYRELESEEWLWVHDPSGQVPWTEGRWAEEDGLMARADRTSYAAGDVAQLAVYAPNPGPALLSLEGGEVRHAEPLTLVSGTNLITLPLRADYAPNIHVTVSQFGPVGKDWPPERSLPEAELHSATAELMLPMTDRRLTVTLAGDSAAYAPGDDVNLHVRVTDSQGEPVIAEISLGVVEEAVYALAEDLARDPFEVFYAPKANAVRTFDSLHPSRWLFPVRDLGDGDGLGRAGAPRRPFLDTAYWAPEVVTDQNGEATLGLRLPENLTQWRALARAVTTDTLVGQATAPVVVSQDIVVRPALPRFLVVGDAVTLTAEVHNQTSRAVSATVALDVQGLVVDGADGRAERVANVPARGSAVASWPVVPESIEGEGEARVLVRTTATSGGTRLVGRGTAERALSVHPGTALEVTTFAGMLTPARPSETLTITLPADAVEGLTRFEARLAPSVAAGVLDGLEYLIDYPFGCVEQTMSRVLANALVVHTFSELGLDDESLPADPAPMVDLGLQRLYGFQHENGGWGWWYDDGTDANLTAYVLLGLAMTEEAGFRVDDGLVERGAEALRQLLVEAEPRTQAYGAYALAMAGRPISVTMGLTEALGLDLFSQAGLVMALDATDSQTMTLALLDNLREYAVQDATSVHWPEEADAVADSRRVMGSTIRTTAMVTHALARLDPQSPLLPGAVRWLMGTRQGLGWGDPQKTSFAIIALTDYLLSSGEVAAAVDYEVYLNQVLWQEGVLQLGGVGETIVLTYSQEISPSLWRIGDNLVTLVLGPQGQAYFTGLASVSRALEGGTIPSLVSHERGIDIQREYRLLGSEEAVTEFAQGHLVEVHLTLNVPEESWYVVVDDPLPAGFVALNERLSTTSYLASASGEPVYHWQDYGYNHKDVRDDRVTFFISHLEAGPQTLTYLARATHAGAYTVLPAHVYPMYDTGVWSRSGSTRLSIAPW